MTANRWQSGTAALITLGMIAGAAAPIVAPIVAPAPAFAQVSFSDVQSNHWAKGFIEGLAARDIIKGFPDGSFRPNDLVTRAQFAAMVRKAFNKPGSRNPVRFADVPSNYWANTAIEDAYQKGFMSGYPGNVFNPNQNIPRVQVLVALSNGLNYTPTGSTANVLQVYSDASSIPDYAINSIAAATEKQIPVNYPDVRLLNPNQSATRADVAAFIYQALVSAGGITALDSPYIVAGVTPPPPIGNRITVRAGTFIPVSYDKAEKILVAPKEPKPVPVTLNVAENIVVGSTVAIPTGSEIVGELQLVQGGQKGAQFVARELVLPNGERVPINANSAGITKTETITKGINAGKVLKNAALGAAAAAAIAAITGDKAIATEEVLLGAGIGTVLTLIGVFQGRDKVELISVAPNTDLNLTLRSDLVLSRY